MWVAIIDKNVPILVVISSVVICLACIFLFYCRNRRQSFLTKALAPSLGSRGRLLAAGIDANHPLDLKSYDAQCIRSLSLSLGDHPSSLLSLRSQFSDDEAVQTARKEESALEDLVLGGGSGAAPAAPELPAPAFWDTFLGEKARVCTVWAGPPVVYSLRRTRRAVGQAVSDYSSDEAPVVLSSPASPSPASSPPVSSSPAPLPAVLRRVVLPQLAFALPRVRVVITCIGDCLAALQPTTSPDPSTYSHAAHRALSTTVDVTQMGGAVAAMGQRGEVLAGGEVEVDAAGGAASAAAVGRLLPDLCVWEHTAVAAWCVDMFVTRFSHQDACALYVPQPLVLRPHALTHAHVATAATAAVQAEAKGAAVAAVEDAVLAADVVETVGSLGVATVGGVECSVRAGGGGLAVPLPSRAVLCVVRNTPTVTPDMVTNGEAEVASPPLAATASTPGECSNTVATSTDPQTFTKDFSAILADEAVVTRACMVMEAALSPQWREGKHVAAFRALRPVCDWLPDLRAWRVGMFVAKESSSQPQKPRFAKSPFRKVNEDADDDESEPMPQFDLTHNPLYGEWVGRAHVLGERSSGLILQRYASKGVRAATILVPRTVCVDDANDRVLAVEWAILTLVFMNANKILH